MIRLSNRLYDESRYSIVNPVSVMEYGDGTDDVGGLSFGDLCERLYNEPRVTYVIRKDGSVDAFGETFIRGHLRVLRGTVSAVSVGLAERRHRRERLRRVVADRIRSRDNESETPRPTVTIVVHQSVIANSAIVSAHGKYNVRGLVLKDDIALWGMIRSIGLQDHRNPMLLPTADEFLKFLSGLTFRPEMSELGRCLARGIAVGQYAATSLMNYHNPGTMPSYLRNVCKRIDTLYRRVSGSKFRMNDDESEKFMDEFMPRTICNRVGIPYVEGDNSVFLNDDYVAHTERMLVVMYDRMCRCEECARIRTESCLTACHVTGVPRRTKHRRFEKNYVTVRGRPEMGVLRLPPLRHLSDDKQDELCAELQRDLMYQWWFQDDDRTVPVWGASARADNLGKEYIMHLVANICLLQTVAVTLRDAIRLDVRCYGKVMNDVLREASALYLERARELEARPVCFPHTENTPERYRSLANVLDDTYRDVEEGSVNIMEGLCTLYRAAGRTPDYRIIPRDVVREELLLHYYFIRRMYTDPSPQTELGESLLTHFLWHGDGTSLCLRTLRRLSCDLNDDELSGVRSRDTLWMDAVPGCLGMSYPYYVRPVRQDDTVYVRRFFPGDADDVMDVETADSRTSDMGMASSGGDVTRHDSGNLRRSFLS